MSTIFLIRHAEYDDSRHILPGRLPVELSAHGIEQAKKLRDYFSDKKIEKIFSSQVERCKQTSEIVSNGKIPIIYDKRLLEVLFAYQGYWVKDNNLPYWMRDSLGGESISEVQKRMIDFWKNAGFEENKNYIICSHGDPLYFLYAYLNHEKIRDDVLFGEEIAWPKIYLPMAGIWPVEFSPTPSSATSKTST